TSGTTSCTLVAAQAGNATWIAASSVTRTVTATLATQAAVTLSGAPSGTYGSTYVVAVSGGSGTGALAFEAVGFCTIDASTATNATVEMTAGVGTCTVGATKAADGNYAARSGSRDITPARAVLSVNADPKTIVYGQADPPLTSTLSGFVEGDTSTNTTISGAASCSRVPGQDVGVHSIACTPGTLSTTNYSFLSGSPANLTVTAATVHITATSTAIVYGDAEPTITPQYSGLQYSRLPQTPPVCTTIVDSTTDAGTYPSTCAGAVDGNYLFTYSAGTVTVNRAPQDITFATPPTPSVYGTSFVVGPTSSSGLTVTVAATISSGCAVTAGTGGWRVTMTSGTTSCILAASQAGDIDYFAAPEVQVTVDAALAAQVGLVLSAPASVTYADSFDETATGGSGTGEQSFTVVSGPCEIDTQSATDASLTMTAGVGTCDVSVERDADANYSSASSSTTVTAVRRGLLVNAAPGSKTYGDADPSLTYTVSGFAVPDDSSIASGQADCTRTAGENTDLYTVSCAPGTLGTDNYSFSTGATADFTIDPRPLTITASDASVVYGEATPAIDPSYDNLANGDTATAVPPICTTAVTLSTAPGEYASNCSGASDSNYDIAYADGTVTVAISAQTITISQAPVTTYGHSAAVTAVASSGLSVNVVASGGCEVTQSPTGWTATITSGITPCDLTATQGGNTDFLPQTALSTIGVARASQSELQLSAATSGVYGRSYPLDISGGSGSGASK
ncbi:MAG TPA: MBG domain-containing protein, partial [Galbitalea sp.]|nr:MBG domain-containing protein [Galbitalea sp.]